MESAILRTILYADIFDYPLTLPELYTYLIGCAADSAAEIELILRTSPRLQQLLHWERGYIVLQGRQDIISKRIQNEPLAQQILTKAHSYGMWLARLPFVRMVAITGAVAMSNPAHARDDIDYILIVEPGRVWLTRALSIALVRFARLRGVELCPNYVLAADQLLQKRVDLYVAHELAQMRPLYGYELYCALMAANTWALDFLPNASPQPLTAGFVHSRAKLFAEYLLAGSVGNWIDHWEYQRKAARFKRKIQNEAAAVIDQNTVKGHFRDHGQRILDAYTERLTLYNVSPE